MLLYRHKQRTSKTLSEGETKMKVMYIINNYQLGSRMRMTPVDKIVEKQRVDKSHTQVIYEINDREKTIHRQVLCQDWKDNLKQWLNIVKHTN